MPSGSVTLKDVAHAVGKSVATVSKALRGHADISPETRAFIAQTAAEMGYTPNITARRLQKKRTDAIGLVLPAPSARDADPFFTELLGGITDAAARHNMDVLVSTRAPGNGEETAYRRLVGERRVDGMFIVQPRENDWRIDFLTTKQFPFVVIGHQSSAPHPSVWVNTAAGITEAVLHLLGEQRRHIALIAPPKNLLFHQTCVSAFSAAMNTHASGAQKTVLATAAPSQKEGYRAAQHLLAENPPDAMLASHDLVAMGAMKAAQDQGFEIGNDIAVVGFGDILLAEYTQPPLTTIHRPTHALGQRATNSLMARINHSDTIPMDKPLETWLVQRQSSSLEFWV